MKIIFTSHVEDKFKDPDTRKLKITKQKLIQVIKNPILEDKLVLPHHSIAELNQELSLNVFWKVENYQVKVITFYPAEKGRYENKILRRR